MQQNETIRRSGVQAAAIDEGLRAYMTRVYGLMSVAMLITGAVAYIVGMDFRALINDQPTIFPASLLTSMFSSPFVYVLMFAPLGMVLFFGAAVNRLSTAGAQAYFWVYAGLVGLSISVIFAIYTGESIAKTFFITAIAFGGLSLYGYTTKKDLSGMGTFLLMGLIGLIVAMVVNIFLASSALEFAISVIGVLIFAGLTAYDTQKIKNEYLTYATQPGGEAFLAKGAIMGALHLYLDFINMFMFLLHFLGNRE